MPENDLMLQVAAGLQKLDIDLPNAVDNYDQLLADLSQKMNDLITHNFSLLVSVLYRLDISEEKLKQLLTKFRDIPAAAIIAEMIIERQLQKIKSVKNRKSDTFSDDERW